MKKIFMTLSAGSTLAVAIALTSCNNAEQTKKQVDEQNAKIQSMVDEKLNGLQDQVNAECTAKVDSMATVAYATWVAEEAKTAKKGGKKTASKPKAKEAPKAEKPKENNAVNRGGTNQTNQSTTIKREGTDQGNKSNVINRGGATKKQ
jgi:hypothetical protein